MPSGFIDDGYTQTAHIEGIDGMYDAIDIEFRPMLAADRRVMFHRVEGRVRLGDKGIDDAEELQAKEVAKRIVSWTLTDRHGAMVAINPANYRRIHPSLQGRIFSLVACLDAPEQGEEDDSESQSITLQEGEDAGN